MNIRCFSKRFCPQCSPSKNALFIGYKCFDCNYEIVLAPINPVDVSNGTAARANSASIRKRGRSFTIGGRKRIYANHQEKLAARRALRAARKAAGKLDGII